MAKYFTVLRVKSELDQLVCGLSSTLNVLDLVRKNSLQMKELFLYHDPPPLTWESVYNLFPAQMSTEGSTKREREEAVMMRWINVITCIEGNLLLQYSLLLYCIIVASSGLVEIKDHTSNEIYSVHITLSDVLKFVTGSPALPPLGFIPSPTIRFQETSVFPVANTCANTLHLPLNDVTDDVFKYRFVSGIANAPGFGRV